MNTLLTRIDKSFLEGLLLFLALAVFALREVAEHLVPQDHHSAFVLPLPQYVRSVYVLLHTGQLIYLVQILKKSQDVFVKHYVTASNKIRIIFFSTKVNQGQHRSSTLM